MTQGHNYSSRTTGSALGPASSGPGQLEGLLTNGMPE